MENRFQKHVKKFECDPSVGSLDTDMLRRYSDPFGGKAQTGRRRRVVAIQRNSMENNLGNLVKTFERDPTDGSIDTDLLNRYSSHVGGMAPTGRRRLVVRSPDNSIENSLRKLMKTFERNPTVGSLDTDLLSRYSGPVGGMAPTIHRRLVVSIPSNSMENQFQKHVKTFECDPTVGCLDTELLRRYSYPFGGKAQTGRRRRVMPIPRNSMENSLPKLVKTFERDQTVRSLDTDLLSRYSGPAGGMAQTGRYRWVVPIPLNSIENSLLKHVKKFECDPRVGSLDTDLLSRYSSRSKGGMTPTVHYRRVVPIPLNSMENSLRK